MLPWLHLFRAVWSAADLRKLLLAAVGLAVWHGGVGVIESLGFFDLTGPQAVVRGFDVDRVETSYPYVAGPLVALFTGPATGARIGSAILVVLWSLIVWGLFGGAISRITALHFSDDHPTSILASLKYAGRRLIAVVSGPLLPLSGVLALGMLLVVAGWVSRIPAVGEFAVGLLWWLVLAVGLFAALLLAGLVVGWPLMVATIAVEGTDSFDALSRAFSYVTQRFWHLAGFLLLSVLLAVAGQYLVGLLGAATVVLANWFVSASGTGFSPAGPDAAEGVAAFFQRGFLRLIEAFLTSYFWTAATLIYFLLRKSVDATPLEEVYIPAVTPTSAEPPVVGIAATEAREAEVAEATPPALDGDD